jgi:heavy metal sensor kinase
MMTLRARLTLWYSSVWILFVLAFTAMLYLAVKNAVRNEVEHFLSEETLAVSQSLTWTRTSFNIENQTPWLELEHQVNSDYAVFLQVLNDSGRVMARSNNLVAAGEFLPATPLAEKSAGTFVEISQKGLPFFLYYHPVHEASGAFLGWMQAAAYENRVTTFLQVLSDWLLLGMLAALLPCVLVGWLMARQALSPLQDIAGLAGSITSDRLNVRIPAPKAKSREIVQLVNALNALLLRLEGAFNRISQFTNDAAHELLTPLTALLSDIDITLRRERKPEDYVATLLRLKLDTERMEEIIKNLLFLARADNGHLISSFAPLDPSRLVQETIDELAPMLYGKTLRVEFTPSPAQLSGNEVLLQQLFTNLLKNAAQHTPATGEIRVACGMEENFWICRVIDSGAGVPAEMREQIFERFVRVDPSRQRETGGAGLGLAIARQIARQHAGEVKLEWSEEGKGSCFKVLLPPAVCSPLQTQSEKFS